LNCLWAYVYSTIQVGNRAVEILIACCYNVT
jgi:hypothetical protein